MPASYPDRHAGSAPSALLGVCRCVVRPCRHVHPGEFARRWAVRRTDDPVRGSVRHRGPGLGASRSRTSRSSPLWSASSQVVRRWSPQTAADGDVLPGEPPGANARPDLAPDAAGAARDRGPPVLRARPGRPPGHPPSAPHEPAAGGVEEGASTLTMQYARNLLVIEAGDDAQALAAALATTPERKIAEIKYAIALEEEYTKDEILQGYLNTVFFGNRSYGVESAAVNYFSVPALPAHAVAGGDAGRAGPGPEQPRPDAQPGRSGRSSQRGARQHGRSRLHHGAGGHRREGDPARVTAPAGSRDEWLSAGRERRPVLRLRIQLAAHPARARRHARGAPDAAADRRARDQDHDVSRSRRTRRSPRSGSSSSRPTRSRRPRPSSSPEPARCSPSPRRRCSARTPRTARPRSTTPSTPSTARATASRRVDVQDLHAHRGDGGGHEPLRPLPGSPDGVHGVQELCGRDRRPSRRTNRPTPRATSQATSRCSRRRPAR